MNPKAFAASPHEDDMRLDRRSRGSRRALPIGVLALGLGCGGTLETGTTKRPTTDKPADDGTCPAERSSVCGRGAFALCVDLQNDPEHCGACGRACTPGIACQAGVCQQTSCTSATIPFAGQAPASWMGSPLFSPDRTHLADINGDGRLDTIDWQNYATTPAPIDDFRVTLGQPAGTAPAGPETYHASSAVVDVFTIDANHDEIDDLLIVSESDVEHPPAEVEIWLGHADGQLTRSSVTSLSGANKPIAVADVSGDGLPDLMMPSTIDSGELSVFLSDSTGALHLSRAYDTGHAVPPGSAKNIFGLYVRDWNGDGSPDLVLITDSFLNVLYNRGDGTFDDSIDCGVFVDVGAGGPDVLVEDFNGDGRADLARGSQPINVMLRLSECGFTPITFYDVPQGDIESRLRAADVNGDGRLDLVSLNTPSRPDGPPGDAYLTVLLGNGDGTFQPGTPTSVGPGAVAGLAVGEATGDQRPDIVISSPDGQTTTLANTCQ